jgi:hypothetical protein
MIAACSTPKPSPAINNSTLGDIIDIGKTIEPQNNTVETPKETTTEQPKETTPTKPSDQFASIQIPVEYKDIAIKKYAVEGESIELKPVAVDYDNDKITYSFSTPLNKDGKWQTKIGDAGFYKVSVTASDGKDQTTETVLLIIKEANRPPQLDCPSEIVLKEGETVSIDCKATDKEGEDILIEYSGWMTQKTKKTGYNDEGTHTVEVKASDATGATTKMIKINVQNENRAPEIKDIADVAVTESDLVKINAQTSDPDGQPVTITYDKPLNAKGEWQTKKGDAGTYDLTISASDGSLTTKKKVKLTIDKLNTAPVFKEMAAIIVEEGDTITLKPQATDDEGDHITYTYSGWMNSDTYTTTYEDAGTYKVTITASDGILKTSQDVTITVKDKNRPPIFKIPA